MCRSYFTPEGGCVNDITITQQMISGAVAGLFYWFPTVYPTDVIKSAMQSDHIDRTKRHYKDLLSCARNLYIQEGGWKRFYRGYVPCIMRTIPASSSMLLVMEKTRQLLS